MVVESVSSPRAEVKCTTTSLISIITSISFVISSISNSISIFKILNLFHRILHTSTFFVAYNHNIWNLLKLP